jgi:serine/threonine-protein kinase RIO1
MSKIESVLKIKNILSIHGCFNLAELDYFDSAPCVGSMGSVVGLVEYFTEDYADVNIYQTYSMSSDPIETYEESYQNFSDEVITNILYLCELWEKKQLDALNASEIII